MSTFYLWIRTHLEPQDNGTDANNRINVLMILTAKKKPVGVTGGHAVTFEDDIKTVLVNAGVLTANSILVGSLAEVPGGVGPYIHIVSMAAPVLRADMTQNAWSANSYELETPFARVTTIAGDKITATDLAYAVKSAVLAVQNQGV